MMAAVAILSGCNGQNNMFNSPSSTLSPATASAELPAPPPPGNVAPAPATPYVLRAESAGPYINFSIYNLGTTDLLVEKQHFAIVSQGEREVIPYDKQSTIIDLPQPAVVKPNGTIEGRAIFKNVNSPIGKRLVYKPDATGTFANINRSTGVQTPQS